MEQFPITIDILQISSEFLRIIPENGVKPMLSSLSSSFIQPIVEFVSYKRSYRLDFSYIVSLTQYKNSLLWTSYVRPSSI